MSGRGKENRICDKNIRYRFLYHVEKVLGKNHQIKMVNGHPYELKSNQTLCAGLH